jgi:sialate O-acetylesterase
MKNSMQLNSHRPDGLLRSALTKLTATALLLGLASVSYADVVLPKVIASKMVLQRGVAAPIWGWADPGEAVTVTFAGQAKQALPDATGKWMIQLDPLTASAESRVMTIQGKNEIQLTDVLVGEVWLASGQSNMEWTFHAIAAEEKAYAVAQKDNKLLRAFHVNQHITAGIPLDDTEGAWKDCTEMVGGSLNSVSAVGFFFALKLQQELEIPVAFIDANWGGQRIEPFIPDEGYKALGLNYQKRPGNPDPKAIAAQLKGITASVDQARQAAEQGRRIPFLAGDRVYGWAEIWYQGESHRGANDYFKKLQALSAGWSQVFNVKDIPFYQVQIAPFDYTRGKNTNDSTLCDTIWKAQYQGAAEIPGMGVVAIHDTDIDIKNIHPVRKLPVGNRLAAQALKNQYGKDVITTGPAFAGAALNGSKVVVSFKHIDQGLSTIDGQAPSWFELSADGKTFVTANAVINGNTVEVSAAGVAAPKFVRMGWKDIAIPNLNDKNGWPVFAFSAQPVQ